MNLPSLNNRQRAIADDMKAVRRLCHQHPQIGFEETFISDQIAECLTRWGISFERGIAQTGIVAWIDGEQTTSNRSIGLRADIDALDLMDKNETPWASTIPGKMHGCGHDGHTATLLAAAQYLNETRRFNGRVYLVFQPAEEGWGGAQRMVDEGLFNRFPMQQVFGFHNWPSLPVGFAALRPGPLMASSDELQITITGKGGHAAMPHHCIDPVLIGAQFVVQAQAIVARMVDPVQPVVLSITNFNAGTGADNVIPDQAVLMGTVRAFDNGARARVEQSLKALAAGLGASTGATINVHYRRNFEPTINSEPESHICADILQTLLGPDRVNAHTPPVMGAEDFGVMLQHRPGCYVFLGQATQDPNSPHNQGLHSSYYDFNDDLIGVGLAYWTALVERVLPVPA